MQTSIVFSKTIKAFNDPNIRYIVNIGSTRSTKTFSVLQLLTIIALRTPNKLITVVGETLPKLKQGCIRDFEFIVSQDNLWNEIDVNKSSYIYTFKRTNTKIEFATFDSETKARGPARDYLAVDESNTIPYPIVDQLIVRTRNKVFLTLNPSSVSWVEREILTQENAVKIHSTYKDNRFLTTEQIRSIESHKNNKAWWKCYGEGEYGQTEFNVYTNWQTYEGDINDVFNSAERLYVGIDWGYMADPTAILLVAKQNDRLYMKELCYRKHLLNDEIAQILKDSISKYKCPVSIVADSAEMKSIDTVRKLTNLPIQPAKKGSDSIIYGISMLQQYTFYVDVHSINLQNELNNYEWQKDRITGEITNTPVDKSNHLADCARYICLNFLSAPSNSRSRVI